MKIGSTVDLMFDGDSFGQREITGETPKFWKVGKMKFNKFNKLEYGVSPSRACWISETKLCRECKGTQEKTVYIDADTINIIDCPKCVRQ